MRVGFNLADDLVEEIDRRAAELFLNRTSYVTLVLAQSIKQDKLIDDKTIKNLKE